MIAENYKTLEQAISVLEILGVPHYDMMVCGSIALDICGLFPENRDAATDIDIVIRVKHDEIESYRRLIYWVNNIQERVMGQEVSPGKPLSLYLKGDKHIDIWLTDKETDFGTNIQFQSNDPVVSGFWVERPIDCINKKKEYNRTKDIKDIQSIVKKLL